MTVGRIRTGLPHNSPTASEARIFALEERGAARVSYHAATVQLSKIVSRHCDDGRRVHLQ